MNQTDIFALAYALVLKQRRKKMKDRNEEMNSIISFDLIKLNHLKAKKEDSKIEI